MADAGMDTASLANGGHENFMGTILPDDLLRVFQGVVVASRISAEDVEPARLWFLNPAADSDTPQRQQQPLPDTSEQGSARQQLWTEWCAEADARFHNEPDLRHVALVTIAVTFLGRCGRKGVPVSPEELEDIWKLIHAALSPDTTGESKLRWTASRSAQGFLSVPLCSLIRDGNIDELFRLHVWLPDGHRGNPDFALHSHQSFAQSWILAGEGKDTPYEVEPAASLQDATHARYALVWADDKDKAKSDATFKTHQQSSTVMNTGDLMAARQLRPSTHARNASYTVPPAAFHTSTVRPETVHATLFFFDSSRGFVRDAPVLGPADAESFTQIRDPAGTTPAELVAQVDLVRRWEVFMARGRRHMEHAEWEHALRELNSALHLCQAAASPEKNGFPNARRYACVVHGELGNTYRRFGRYEQAEEHLRSAMAGLPVSSEKVEFSGELGVLYRHMGRMRDARAAFTDQYDTAKALGFQGPMCRAVGNLGMVNYQLFVESGDTALLDTAILNLDERVERARELQIDAEAQLGTDGSAASTKRQAHTWEIIGLTRLSLCHAARGDTETAVGVASRALELATSSKDTTVVAITRMFYGLALLKHGNRDEALAQFNPPQGCSPAMALCKEPSEEHVGYLRELVDAGADLDLVDEQGYTALDYAVFAGDPTAEAVVLAGLRRVPGRNDDDVAKLRADSLLRKGYRDVFQEQLRPVLFAGTGGDGSIAKLRARYAAHLAQDPRSDGLFDRLKFVRYTDFLAFGRFPRSDDGLTRTFAPGEDKGAGREFVVFVSYRWLNVATENDSPDDANHTQFNRMVAAVRSLLTLHPTIDPSRLSLWLVCYDSTLCLIYFGLLRACANAAL